MLSNFTFVSSSNAQRPLILRYWNCVRWEENNKHNHRFSHTCEQVANGFVLSTQWGLQTNHPVPPPPQHGKEGDEIDNDCLKRLFWAMSYVSIFPPWLFLSSSFGTWIWLETAFRLFSLRIWTQIPKRRHCGKPWSNPVGCGGILAKGRKVRTIGHFCCFFRSTGRINSPAQSTKHKPEIGEQQLNTREIG